PVPTGRASVPSTPRRPRRSRSTLEKGSSTASAVGSAATRSASSCVRIGSRSPRRSVHWRRRRGSHCPKSAAARAATRAARSFRGRLLFPIRDLQGRVVAFGGRGFGDEQPKYLNSPETPLYTKGNLLYAADLARPTIQTQNRALLVEGYVDCIMAHQHGFTGTVAALGTAFTPAQLTLLRRYCDEVVTFFDADAAGQKAAARAEELLEPTG